ncbi:unnamed protein product [Trifolium pratense]|uniref:Uncharacterized protein n=1 Tax=Trifolium pratense TaxID=57577 RepID=A0ACB0J430_TRIPR|nr:unnamed protein product [Trifolium pratense]
MTDPSIRIIFVDRKYKKYDILMLIPESEAFNLGSSYCNLKKERNNQKQHKRGEKERNNRKINGGNGYKKRENTYLLQTFDNDNNPFIFGFNLGFRV